MEGAPKNLEGEKIVAAIVSEEKIKSVHDFHLWTITSGLHALTCHAVVSEEMDFREAGGILKRINHALRKFGIKHATINGNRASLPEASLSAALSIVRLQGGT